MEEKSNNKNIIIKVIVILLLIIFVICLITYKTKSINQSDVQAGINNSLSDNSNIAYTHYSIEYNLDNYDTGFLATTIEQPTKYEIFDNYADYSDYYNSIDSWSQDMIKNYTNDTNKRIDNSVAEDAKIYSDPEKSKLDIINDYTQSINNRVAKIKEGFQKGKYSEEFFNDNSLILVEHSVFGQILNDIQLGNIEKNGSELNIQFDTDVSGVIGGGQSRIFFITIPKKDIEKIDNINININSVNTSIPGLVY